MRRKRSGPRPARTAAPPRKWMAARPHRTVQRESAPPGGPSASLHLGGDDGRRAAGLVALELGLARALGRRPVGLARLAGRDHDLFELRALGALELLVLAALVDDLERDLLTRLRLECGRCAAVVGLDDLDLPALTAPAARHGQHRDAGQHNPC